MEHLVLMCVPLVRHLSRVSRVEPGVETAFLGTRSGMMRIIRYAGVETRVAKYDPTQIR